MKERGEQAAGDEEEESGPGHARSSGRSPHARHAQVLLLLIRRYVAHKVFETEAKIVQ